MRNFISVLAGVIILVICWSTFFGGADYEQEAEAYVNSCVYKELDVVPERFQSKIVYDEDDDVLVEVKFYLEGSSNNAGVYCVYFRSSDVVYNCTEMLPSGFDSKARLNELKALFGI